MLANARRRNDICLVIFRYRFRANILQITATRTFYFKESHQKAFLWKGRNKSLHIQRCRKILAFHISTVSRFNIFSICDYVSFSKPAPKSNLTWCAVTGLALCNLHLEILARVFRNACQCGFHSVSLCACILCALPQSDDELCNY